MLGQRRPVCATGNPAFRFRPVCPIRRVCCWDCLLRKQRNSRKSSGSFRLRRPRRAGRGDNGDATERRSRSRCEHGYGKGASSGDRISGEFLIDSADRATALWQVDLRRSERRSLLTRGVCGATARVIHVYTSRSQPPCLVQVTATTFQFCEAEVNQNNELGFFGHRLYFELGSKSIAILDSHS